MSAQSFDFEQILSDAKDASADAAITYLNNYGDRADCGGAWVVIPNGRGAFARWLKAQGLATANRGESGVGLSILAGLRCQSRIIYEKGCDAFVEVLRAYGIDAHTYSYAD